MRNDLMVMVIMLAMKVLPVMMVYHSGDKDGHANDDDDNLR